MHTPSHTHTHSHSWADQLVPIIISAQTKLTERTFKHKHTLLREKVEPAAHLDPGPEGHNIYGKMGHALALVSVSLDTNTVLKRLNMQQREIGTTNKDCNMMLSHARSLLVRYIAGLKMEGENIEECVRDGVLPRSQLAMVVSAYDKAIDKLVDCGDEGLSSQAMNELGDLFQHSGHLK